MTRHPAAVERFLIESELLAPGDEVEMTPLTGGVSSDLWRVDLPSGSICVKGALARLKVAAEWFAPVSRNEVEYRWLQFAHALRPQQVPRVLAHDAAAGLFAMEFLPVAQHPVWKRMLLAGHVDVGAARAVGELVGFLHAASAENPESSALFATDDNFDALRIEPFFGVTARAHPDLAGRLAELAERTTSLHLTVVHGDVSPKNVLLGPHGPVLLDAECAWFGDPAFDVAFCLNHLILKSVKLPLCAAALRTAARALADAYLQQVRWEPAEAVAGRVVDLLPALALARIDGSSPVEYLGPDQRASVRNAAKHLLREPSADLDQLLDRWAGLTARRTASV